MPRTCIGRFASVLALGFLFSFLGLSHAGENFIPGIYTRGSDGTRYIVSGATSTNGRTVWTMVTTRETARYFNAIWETGPSIGNMLLAGGGDATKYPVGKAYGVIGDNTDSQPGYWEVGSTLSASQDGETLTVARLSSNGSVADSVVAQLTARAPTGLATSEQFLPGVYRNQNGHGFLVTGAPSQTGRSAWSLVALPDSPKTLNAVWETGATKGNAILAGSVVVDTFPEGYLAGRSYGRVGRNEFSWPLGAGVAAVQAGNTISLSYLASDGVTYQSFVLVKDESVAVALGTGSEIYSAGTYRDDEGRRFALVGANAPGGRTAWTLSSSGMPATFNAVWVTGPASGNPLVAGGELDWPNEYLGGRSYGTLGKNGIWNVVTTTTRMAAAQTGASLVLYLHGHAGGASDLFVLRQESASSASLGESTEVPIADSYYQDVSGNTYAVSLYGDWQVTGTGSVALGAAFQTGPASSNGYVNKLELAKFPMGYLPGRSYGLVQATPNDLGWELGGNLGVLQVGKSMTVSWLWTDGATYDMLVLTKGGTGGLGGTGKLAFGVARQYASRFDGVAILSVERTDGGKGAASVSYSTADGTAISGIDYSAVSAGVLNWADGDTGRKFVNVAILPNARGASTFTVTLSNASGATLGAQSTTTITILASNLGTTGERATRYRLYSPGTKEHLYTTDLVEYNWLPAHTDFKQEGPTHVIFKKETGGWVNGVAAVPYYRLYNPYSYQHHWTTDAVEYNYLPSVGWQPEGADGYILPTQAAGSVPLYRLNINAFGGLHLWTTDLNEVNYLTTNAGWEYEGIAGYVIPLQ